MIDRKRERGGSSCLFTPHQSTTCLLFLARDSVGQDSLLFISLHLVTESLRSFVFLRSSRSSGPLSSLTKCMRERKRYRERETRDWDTRSIPPLYLLSWANELKSSEPASILHTQFFWCILQAVWEKIVHVANLRRIVLCLLVVIFVWPTGPRIQSHNWRHSWSSSLAWFALLECWRQACVSSVQFSLLA